MAEKDKIQIEKIAKQCAKDYSILKNKGVDASSVPPRQWIRAWMQTHYNIIKLSGYFYREVEKALDPRQTMNEGVSNLGLVSKAKSRFSKVDTIDNLEVNTKKVLFDRLIKILEENGFSKDKNPHHIDDLRYPTKPKTYSTHVFEDTYQTKEGEEHKYSVFYVMIYIDRIIDSVYGDPENLTLEVKINPEIENNDSPYSNKAHIGFTRYDNVGIAGVKAGRAFFASVNELNSIKKDIRCGSYFLKNSIPAKERIFNTNDIVESSSIDVNDEASINFLEDFKGLVMTIKGFTEDRKNGLKFKRKENYDVHDQIIDLIGQYTWKNTNRVPKKVVNESSNLGLNKKVQKKFDKVDAIDNISDYVDLGLPSGTLWCSHNYGVDNEYECGNLYNHVDAVELNLLPGQLPSPEDFGELKNFCKHKISEVNGVKGIVFISKKNSNEIFFPIADHYGGLNFVKPYGYYWSSELYQNDAAYNMKFDLSLVIGEGFVNTCNTSYRSYGFLVRAVLKKANESINLGLNKKIQKKFDDIDSVKNLQMEFVDLGLRSGNLWKNFNEGAKSVEDSGRGYTYDEAIKSKFDEGNLPNEDDFKELYVSCKFDWDKERKGMIVTSNINGNSIFLPAPGYIGTIGRMENPGAGTYGCYWMLPGDFRNTSPNKGSGFDFMISNTTGVFPFHVNSSNMLYCVRCISRRANESVNLGLNKQAKKKFKDADAIDNISDFVDLGLPSGNLWSKCNAGASSEEEFGEYFKFGEKPEGCQYDVPSFSDFKELNRYCIFKFTEINGTKGLLVTSRNGNTLFFPAAGSINHISKEKICVNDGICYWTSFKDTDPGFGGGRVLQIYISRKREGLEFSARCLDERLPIKLIKKKVNESTNLGLNNKVKKQYSSNNVETVAEDIGKHLDNVDDALDFFIKDLLADKEHNGENKWTKNSDANNLEEDGEYYIRKRDLSDNNPFDFAPYGIIMYYTFGRMGLGLYFVMDEHDKPCFMMSGLEDSFLDWAFNSDIEIKSRLVSEIPDCRERKLFSGHRVMDCTFESLRGLATYLNKRYYDIKHPLKHNKIDESNLGLASKVKKQHEEKYQGDNIVDVLEPFFDCQDETGKQVKVYFSETDWKNKIFKWLYENVPTLKIKEDDEYRAKRGRSKVMVDDFITTKYEGGHISICLFHREYSTYGPPSYITHLADYFNGSEAYPLILTAHNLGNYSFCAVRLWTQGSKWRLTSEAYYQDRFYKSKRCPQGAWRQAKKTATTKDVQILNLLGSKKKKESSE